MRRDRHQPGRLPKAREESAIRGHGPGDHPEDRGTVDDQDARHVVRGLELGDVHGQTGLAGNEDIRTVAADLLDYGVAKTHALLSPIGVLGLSIVHWAAAGATTRVIRNGG